MHIVSHAHLRRQRGGGEERLAAADRSLGVTRFEVWLRTLAAGARGAEERHDGELVVLVLAGCGKLLVDGAPQRFAAPCTVVVPPRLPFQFVNHGTLPLQMVAVGAVAAPPRPTRRRGPSGAAALAPSGDDRAARRANTVPHAESGSASSTRP